MPSSRQGVRVGNDDIDVVAGAQDIMFGCGSDETELSWWLLAFEEEIYRRVRKEENDGRKNGDMWWLRLSASGGAHAGKDDLDADAGGSRHHVGARGCGDGNSFEEGTDVRKNGDQWWLCPDGKTS